MHLALATNTLCVDEKDYEKAIKTFQEYANQEVFKRRVETGKKLNILRGGREMPREINYTLLHKMPSNWSSDGWKREKAERNLFKSII